MSWLSLLLIVKIIITFTLVALPFLFFPKGKLEKISKITTSSSMFFRLYGVAILALLVGYSFGVISAENNQFPWGIIYMGVVSNCGAASLLLMSQSGRQNKLLGVFFSLIALGLIASLIFPEAALRHAC